MQEIYLVKSQNTLDPTVIGRFNLSTMQCEVEILIFGTVFMNPNIYPGGQNKCD